ncbi:MAG: four helix bundle protein [Candidatus Liptonbacteria bacterium]|nr:four helix bundle protein [Candidatus Liptonbacteria bacterium]
MLKQSKSPDGYKRILAYKKAEELQSETLAYTATFPKDKTGVGLADQMDPVRGPRASRGGHQRCPASNGVDRSARSTKQNVVEGWKRNATHEYYTFLGYAVASNAELQEDCADICLGRYESKGIKGATMGEKGIGQQNSTLPPILPILPILPFSSISKSQLETLRFYPLDTTLPKPVQLYLRCKELNFLLEKLQASLLARMQEKKTLSHADHHRLILEKAQQRRVEEEKWYQNQLARMGLVMTPQGMKQKAEMGEMGRKGEGGEGERGEIGAKGIRQQAEREKGKTSSP